MISRRNITRSFYRAAFDGWLRDEEPHTSPSPGTVEGSWVGPSVKGSLMMPSVEGSFLSGSVKGSVIFLNEVK